MILKQPWFASLQLYDLYMNGAPRKGNSIPPGQQKRCVRLLDALEAATKPADLALPGYGFARLRGGYKLDVMGLHVITFSWVSGAPDNIDYS